jgi:uncharacterized protein
MSTDIPALARQLLDALNSGDREQLRACYCADAAIWHNFDDQAQGVEDNLRVFDWMQRRIPNRRYRILRQDFVADGWWQQHIVEGELPDGRQLKMHACCRIQVRDGRVARIEEYLDPAQAAVLRK